jgi:hypothetical protein
VSRLLASSDRHTAPGLRDYALVVTYLDTGARCSELLTLTLADVHLDHGWLLLDGKGNKERMVRLGATARAALRHWLSRGRPAMAAEGAPCCFVDARTGGVLQVNAVECRIRLLGQAALPDRRVYCHLFRHTFATNYLVYGLGDELHLMATLGHTTLLMVRHYVDKAKFLKALKERQGSVMDTLAGAWARGRPKQSGLALWAARRAGASAQDPPGRQVRTGASAQDGGKRAAVRPAASEREPTRSAERPSRGAETGRRTLRLAAAARSKRARAARS